MTSLRCDIQPRAGEGRPSWEQVCASTDTRHLSLLHFWGKRGLFIWTKLVTLVAGIMLATFDTAQLIFLIVGSVGSFLTIILLNSLQRKGHSLQETIPL